MTTDYAPAIAAAKAALKQRLPNYKDVFADMAETMDREAGEIAARHADGEQVVPEVNYSDIAAGTVPAGVSEAVRRYGCVVVRGVFPRAQAEAWDAELLHYVQDNDYIEKAKAKVGLDKYFSALKSGKPQIYGIYWSKPQMQARQGESMAAARAWLNRLWTWEKNGETFFNPDRNYNYADRIRQREPGDKTLGLSRMLMAAPSNAGSTPVFTTSIAMCLRATGVPTTRGTGRGAPRPTKSRRPPCAACSAPIRAGRP